MYTSFHISDREKGRKAKFNVYVLDWAFYTYFKPSALMGYTQVIGYVNKQWGEKLCVKFVEMDVIEIC